MMLLVFISLVLVTYQPLPEMSFQMAPYVAELLEDTAGDLGLHREDVLQAVWPRLKGYAQHPFALKARILPAVEAEE